jgi:hypothetical protein
VKGQKIVILVLIIFNAFSGAGIILINPMGASGQTKEKIILAQEIGRDPFRLPPGVHLLSKTGTPLGMKGFAPKAETDREVKAILIADHIRLASIDHHIVTVGDSVRDEKVLEIKTDRVILGKGDQKRTLPLSQSPIPLTVEKSPPLPPSPTMRGGKEGGKGESQ